LCCPESSTRFSLTSAPWYTLFMKTLREYVADASAKKIAIGHFNISDISGLWAVFNAAKELVPGQKTPIIIGASEGEREFIGIPQVAALVKSVREEFDYPIFLNGDHTYSFEKVKAAIDAGFDSVIFDGAQLSFADNIAQTKQCVDYAREVTKKTGRDILLEGELGYIGQSSKVLDAIPAGVGLSGDALTSPEQATEFVKKTGIDMLAPAIGSFHGMVRGMTLKPGLDIARIAAIHDATGVPLVLHGGSGNKDADFTNAVTAGMAIVHINTEIRVAYRKALESFLQQNPDEVAPYKYLREGMNAMQTVVSNRLKLFNKIS
jgi:fructose-bisphosphate aldolase class II